MLKDKRISYKKRVVHVCYPFFAFLLLIFSSVYSSAFALDLLTKDLQEVRTTAESGAVSLALQSIDEYQQILYEKNDLPTWLDWERERINIYKLGQRWQTLEQRVANYEKKLPIEFYYWAKQQQVDALLILKQGQQARQILQDLIWSKEHNLEQENKIHLQWLPVWQKRVIKSYLVDNETSDALLAVQRYYQDYRTDDVEDRLLRARILLLNKREEEVVELLMKDTKHPEGGMLYLLAQLRSDERPAKKVLQSALRQMRGKWASHKLKYMLWAVVAESARRSGDRPSTVNALEFVLAGNKNIDLPAGLFNFNADTLWNAYIDYALYLGNRAQFLIGNDKQWLDAAIKAEKKYPVKARSLYAMVLIRGQNEDARIQAAKGFLNLMHKRKRGAELVMQLFLKSEFYKDIKLIPAPVRYDLVDVALNRSDIELASNMMTTILSAPTGADNYQWQLRRARIFVLGGKAENGSETLKTLIEKNETFTPKQLDHFLQVVFDLQTVKEHELAYQLFDAILPKIDDSALQREIYYWMADSRKAQEDYVAAARLYLRSAMHGDKKGLDPWGQTARYQTAEMLVKADLLQDAHALYEQLLKVTKEPARRAVLKHELQKLWLLKHQEIEKDEAPAKDEEQPSDEAPAKK